MSLNEINNSKYQQGIFLFDNDLFNEAEILFNQVLNDYPKHSGSLSFLGIIYSNKNMPEKSEKYLRKAILNSKPNAVYYNALAITLKSQNKIQEAFDYFNKAISTDPNFAGAKYNFANMLKSLGQFQDAINLYHQSIKIDPNLLYANYNLANTLGEIGDFNNAIIFYEKVMRIDSNFIDAYFNTAKSYESLDQMDNAIYMYKRVLKINPEHIDSIKGIASSYETMGMTEKAIIYLKKALEIEKDNQLLQMHIENICPPINLSNFEIDTYRQKMELFIQKYSKLDLKIDLKNIYENIQPAYNMLYHGRDYKNIREEYAKIFTNSFSAFNMSQNQSPEEGSVNSIEPQDIIKTNKSERIHLLFLVTNSHEGVFIKCMRGIILNLPTTKFKISIICSLAKHNQLRSYFKDKEINYVSLERSFETNLEIIKNLNADIIYHWEVGSDTTNYFLPFFNLAPIQCTGFGWPDTTGIKNMDYYISSKYIEPENAQKHYTEKLEIFNELPFYYYEPSFPKNSFKLSDFGIDENKNIYACLQSLRKVEPDFDDIIAKILSNDPNGQVIFLGDKSDYLDSCLNNRIKTKYPELSLRIKILPRLNAEEYYSLLPQIDVALDSVQYTGVNTTYECLSAGVPIINLPGDFARGRFTYAAYKHMEMDDCIALNNNDYVDKCLKIAMDKTYRKDISQKILERKGILFEKKELIDEYINFFEKISGK